MGLDRFIVDPLALSDPLLARLPSQKKWRIGHFERDLPKGYFESVETSTNLIANPSLREYYDRLNVITRGEQLFSIDRLTTIVQFNLGHYDYLIQEYLIRTEAD